MKNFRRFLFSAVAIIAMSISAAAQFSIGPRVGINVNSMHFDSDLFKSENRAGFTGGLQAEFMIPMVGFGFDASVMYVHRVNNATVDTNGTATAPQIKDKDYIEIPVNLKYKIGLPVIGKIITPYVFTGPSFAFLTSRKAINEAWKNKSTSVAWNFGFGVQLLGHLQVGASYGLGMTKAFEKIGAVDGVDIQGKNRYWTVTAAYLF
ncbi:MAG: PorT family protein [Bacteroides sp.]|nr:PorT family protein [Bacteroides sp.]MCM1456923.1 PorT family protein [Lachnoclostridium sp.]